MNPKDAYTIIQTIEALSDPAYAKKILAKTPAYADSADLHLAVAESFAEMHQNRNSPGHIFFDDPDVVAIIDALTEKGMGLNGFIQATKDHIVRLDDGRFHLNVAAIAQIAEQYVPPPARPR
ncbi:MAG: hypothetical protein SFT92_03305 [Rickettsiales bacterium]|nr:hypothetical protein [Rickettsiales bacterium]